MDVTEKLAEIIQSIKTSTYQKEDSWEKYSYRVFAATFKVPYNDVKLYTTLLRSHPNIDYRYVPTEARYRPIKYRYVDFSENRILLEKFQSLTAREFDYAMTHIPDHLPVKGEEEIFAYTMTLLILIEEMKRTGFLEEWTHAKIGSFVRLTGRDYREIEEALDCLCEDRILKQLGAGRLYRLALSDQEYEKLEDSAASEQFHSVLENSQAIVDGKTGDSFQVLTEMNEIARNVEEFIAYNSEMAAKLLRQQKILRVLQEKEGAYAGTLVRMDAVIKNYAQNAEENQKLKEENQKLKQRSKQEDKFYKERRADIAKQLDAMASSLISILETYFSRPVREKGQPAITNRTKAEVMQTIFQTIDSIKRGGQE